MGCRNSLDPALLWLWCRPAAVAPVRPLAWEPPFAMGVALKRQKDQKKDGLYAINANILRVGSMAFYKCVYPCNQHTSQNLE